MLEIYASVKSVIEVSKGQRHIKKGDQSIYINSCLVSSEFLDNSGIHGRFLNPKFLNLFTESG